MPRITRQVKTPKKRRKWFSFSLQIEEDGPIEVSQGIVETLSLLPKLEIRLERHPNGFDSVIHDELEMWGEKVEEQADTRRPPQDPFSTWGY